MLNLQYDERACTINDRNINWQLSSKVPAYDSIINVSCTSAFLPCPAIPLQLFFFTGLITIPGWETSVPQGLHCYCVKVTVTKVWLFNPFKGGRYHQPRHNLWGQFNIQTPLKAGRLKIGSSLLLKHARCSDPLIFLTSDQSASGLTVACNLTLAPRSLQQPKLVLWCRMVASK